MAALGQNSCKFHAGHIASRVGGSSLYCFLLEAIASRLETPLGAPGLTSRNKKLLEAPGIATNRAIGRY